MQTLPTPAAPDVVRGELLAGLFEATADRYGNRTALEFEGRSLTYGELDARANRLARLLQERGAGPGVYVGLFLPRGLDALVALLAILKAGAAYVPLDPDTPPDRVRAILQDSSARLLVSSLGLAAPVAGGPWTPVLLEEEAAALEALSPARPPCRARPGDPCYAIFTSGSTGRPKGVAVAHRSVCNLVRAEGGIFGVNDGDRVFQGFSLAFDASVEEIWLAWHAGAALVAGGAAVVKNGPALPAWLRERGITVLSTVPTLLGTFDEDVPGLRLLILGGEACPQDLVRRWAPSRRMVNTYGPTEACVIATWTDLAPDRPVTIGRAIPNLRTYVLDPDLAPASEGELCLSGIGLALGYLGRPDLTAERFPANPYADGPHTERLYRTGDKVRVDAAGDLEFLGRLDDQVKLRGFRVELGEIEAALRAQAGVQGAAAAVRSEGGPDQLVGYVAPGPADEDALRAALRRTLPSYMIPARIVALEALPVLPSGKLDRKALPAPPPRAAADRTPEAPSSPRERALAEAWARLFHLEAVGLDQDFFTDLGGHSLLAALMVSELRRTGAFLGLSVPDVYACPTVRLLAKEMDARNPAPQAPAPVTAPRPRWVRWLCQGAQAAGLYPLLGYFGLQWLAPYLTYSWLIDHDFDRAPALAAAAGVILVLNPAMFLLSIAAKWILLGRVRPGIHPLWGSYHLRWWLATRIQAATPTGYLVGTPWMRAYLRLMGARVGPHTHFATDCMRGFDLLSVGADTCIGVDARLEAYVIENGALRLGPITVGSRCCVGARAVLAPGTVMEDGAELGDLSMLPEGARIPAEKHWVGSPALPLPGPDRSGLAPSRPGRARIAAMAVAQGLAAFLVPVVFLASILPGMMLLNELWIDIPGYFGYLWAVPLAAISYVVLLSLIIVGVKRAAIGRVKAGTYDLTSFYYLRKWFVDQLMEISLDLLGPLYATLYLNPWFRALGATIGRRAEISTAGAATPDLLEIGEETFIADAASLGTPRFDLGRVTLAPTRVGRRAFVGNSSAVPGGTSLGDLALVGVLSVPPLDPAEAARVDASWLGSPAIFLPRRHHAEGFGEDRTFTPSRRLVALRLGIEFFRVTLPAMAYALLTCLMLTTLTVLEERIGLGRAILLFPLLYFAAGVAASIFTVAMKWVLIGRYRPCEKPLWCGFVWRTELVSSLHENLAASWLLNLCQGTALLPAYFRLLGARVGRGVHMETIWMTEFDLVRIGDGVCLGPDCTLQTHLFEDRVMKMSTVDLGEGCSVGTDAVVLYGTRLEPGSHLGDLSLLMKGETLPEGTRWHGSPARRLP
ncbi:Pls/PosA family non-ribosomal peptide synthetase [Mesoterricola silvestris]|uniref:Peptide synthetase n=1 Tax=Mesoterricola silvestris TaxID=2927979 RepID=A0AA48KAB1_9BACT|nr:Pls/PosA family non-ribosomal peptide synthetase [Mesoterricola silvestris]BDU73925.1 peptide synthetase [Mesoterricola silvestris]